MHKVKQYTISTQKHQISHQYRWGCLHLFRSLTTHNRETKVNMLTTMAGSLGHSSFSGLLSWGGDVAQMVEHQTSTLPMQVRFPSAARDLSPGVNFQCRLSYGVCTPPCAIACIYVCEPVKDPIVHVRVWWIIKNTKTPRYTVGWVARLCRGWLSPEKATRTSYGRNPIGTIQL